MVSPPPVNIVFPMCFPTSLVLTVRKYTEKPSPWPVELSELQGSRDRGIDPRPWLEELV